MLLFFDHCFVLSNVMSAAQPHHEDYTVIGDIYSSKKAIHDIYLVYRDVPKLIREFVLSHSQQQPLRMLDYGCGSAGSTSVLKQVLKQLNVSAGICGETGEVCVRVRVRFSDHTNNLCITQKLKEWTSAITC